MALTVRNLYKESVKYHMKPLAGESGFGNLVQWVHIIETIEGVRFLHGQELVITECIQGNDEDRLLAFVKELYARNASALIVRFGSAKCSCMYCVAFLITSVSSRRSFGRLSMMLLHASYSRSLKSCTVRH